MASKEPKYRISLTLPQIRYLVSVAQLDTTEAMQRLRDSTISTLKLSLTKAELGITAPAFVASEKQSLEEKLGLIDPASRREIAYKKWSNNPSLCTSQEIADAQLYRYENDMMTPDEENEYEQATFN